MTFDNAQQIYQEMRAAGFRREAAATDGLEFVGALEAGGRQISVAVRFRDTTLTCLPKLRLLDKNRDLPDAVAHIEPGDYVCFAQETDLLLNPLQPRQSVAICLNAMRRSLDRLARLDLSDEIATEFPQHWQANSTVYFSESFATDCIARSFEVVRPSGSVVVVARKQSATMAFGSTRELNAHVPILTTRSSLTFRPRFRQPTNLEELQLWAGSINSALPHQIWNALASCDKDKMIAFVSAPNGIVGFKASLPSLLSRAVQRQSFLRRMLDTHGSEIRIDRIRGTQADENTILERNFAGHPNLSALRIAIVGVGTIGGYLAKFLAQSGAGALRGNLQLIDKETFEPGNVGRHFLSASAIGLPKSIACRDALKAQFPQSNFSAKIDNVLEGLHDLASFDIVINATGDEALTQVLDAHLLEVRKNQNGPPCLHIWVTGSGVAAQALLVDSNEFACYRCLKTIDGRWRYPVMKPDHPAHTIPADCGEGTYFAYGVAAPAIAAGLAAQICFDWRVGRPSPRFRTIRVCHEHTIGVRDQNASKLAGCPSCAVCETH